jgi:hypothetical protein
MNGAPARRKPLGIILTTSRPLHGWVTEGGSRSTILVASGQPCTEIGKAVPQQANVPAAARHDCVWQGLLALTIGTGRGDSSAPNHQLLDIRQRNPK